MTLCPYTRDMFEDNMEDEELTALIEKIAQVIDPMAFTSVVTDDEHLKKELERFREAARVKAQRILGLLKEEE